MDEVVPPRDVRPVDWGVFAGLEGMLSQRVHAQGVGSAEGEVENRIVEEIRQSMNVGPRLGDPVEGENGYGYWTKERARDAEEYVWDVVFGGVDGLAYVRSLAEFVSAGNAVGFLPWRFFFSFSFFLPFCTRYDRCWFGVSRTAPITFSVLRFSVI